MKDGAKSIHYSDKWFTRVRTINKAICFHVEILLLTFIHYSQFTGILLAILISCFWVYGINQVDVADFLWWSLQNVKYKYIYKIDKTLNSSNKENFVLQNSLNIQVKMPSISFLITRGWTVLKLKTNWMLLIIKKTTAMH